MIEQKRICNEPSNHLAKNKCFAKLLESINFGLRYGQGYPLSDLRDTINGYSDEVDIFSNRHNAHVKDSKRLRRTRKPAVLYSNITLLSKLPKDMNNFWPSNTKKSKLQQLLKDWLIEMFTKSSTDFYSVLSKLISEESSSTLTQSIRNCFMEQHHISHAIHAIRNDCKRIVILSSDTEVFVLALHFYPIFEIIIIIKHFF